MAMHAPLDVDWMECSAASVFVGDGGPQGEGDTAPDPIQHVLPQVIEATNRVLIGNGDFDMIIITNGTLLAIRKRPRMYYTLFANVNTENMTWNGELGFQQAPSTPINITLPDLEYAAVFDANGADGLDGPQGIMGVQHFERGLMWVETYQSVSTLMPQCGHIALLWLASG